METTILKCSFLFAVMIYGLYTTWQAGMIFYNLKIEIENLIYKLFSVQKAELICKPLFNCPMCMSSVWGILFCIFFGVKITLYLPTIIATCGFVRLLCYFGKMVYENEK